MKHKGDPEASRAKADEAKALLDQAVAGIQSSEGFRAYLSSQARFHKYSFGNTLLIAAQRPEATHVAGYRAWQAQGRQVRKGEKGITIISPITFKREKEDGGEEVGIRGFGTTTVFDVEQTDGEPLPPGPICERLETATARGRELLAILSEWCHQQGVSLSFETVPGHADGFYSPTANRIVVEAGNAVDQQAKTLLHEVAHSILHRDLATRDRGKVEVEAEATAFVVATAFGMETSSYSFGYVAAWQGQDDTLRQSGSVIQKTAHALIEDLSRTPAQTAAG